MRYRVSFEYDAEADSPEEAAVESFKYMLESKTLPYDVTVVPWDAEGFDPFSGKPCEVAVVVDLNELIHHPPLMLMIRPAFQWTYNTDPSSPSGNSTP